VAVLYVGGCLRIDSPCIWVNMVLFLFVEFYSNFRAMMSCVKIILVKYKIIIGFYDSHCLTVNTRHEVSQKYVAVFCFMFATCVLNESACIILMTFGYLKITLFIIIFATYTYPVF